MKLERRLIGTRRWTALAVALGAMALAPVTLGAEQRRASVTVQPQSPGTATAKCKSGQVALAAGFGASPFDPNSNGGPIVRLVSKPAGKDGIATTGFNFNNTDSGTLYSYAYCGKRRRPPKVVSSDVEVDANSVGSVVAKCPRGSRAIAGGFGTDQFIITLVSKRSGNRGWKVAGFNIGDLSSGQSGTLTSYAYCKSPGPRLVTKSQDKTVSTSLKTTNVKCPHGGKAVSGGFDGNINTSGSQLNAAGALTSKRYAHARGWTTEAISAGAPNQATITTYAYCRR
jgi:hypothetical protein